MYRIIVFVCCTLYLMNILSASPTAESCKLSLSNLNPSVTYQNKLLIPTGNEEIFEIPYDEEITLTCNPGVIRAYYSEELTAQCKGGTELLINGDYWDFTIMRCGFTTDIVGKIESQSKCPNGAKLARFGLSRTAYNRSVVVNELCFDPFKKHLIFGHIKGIVSQNDDPFEPLQIGIEPVEYFNRKNSSQNEDAEYIKLLEQFGTVLSMFKKLNETFALRPKHRLLIHVYGGVQKNSTLSPAFVWILAKLETKSMAFVFLEQAVSADQHICENRCNQLEPKTKSSYVDNGLLYCCNYADLKSRFLDFPNVDEPLI